MSLRIAVGARYLVDRTAAEVVEIARRLGADGVEIDQSHLAKAMSSPDEASVDPVGLCVAGRLGLVGVSLADLAVAQDDELAAVVSALCEQVGAAAWVGLPAVNFATGQRELLTMKTLVRSMSRVCQIGESSQLRIEVRNRLGSRLEQIEDLRQFVAAVEHPVVRLRIDTGECYAAAVNPRDVFAEFGDVAGSVVLSDRQGRDEVRLGEGRVNLAGFVADLVRGDYDGWIVINARGMKKRCKRIP